MDSCAARCALLILGCLLASASIPGGLAAQSWLDLNPKERYDALQNYRQHEQLPEDRQREVEKGYERWQQMSPDERQRVRKNYERFRQLPPQERERFQRKYQKWKQNQPAQ